MAGYGYMAKIGADTTDLQRGLKEINSSLRSTDSELYKVNKSIKTAAQAGTDSSAMLKQKEDILNEAIAETERKLNDLRSVEENVRNAANSGNISAQNYRDYQREVANTEAQLRQYQNQLLQTQQAEQGSASANQMVVTSLSDVQTALNNVAGDLGWFLDKIKEVSSAALTNSERMAKYALNVGQAFESSMSQVKAYSGAVGEDFEKLESAAKEAGATTSRSASEAADALGYMALAGWDTQQMLDGLMPIVRASEAGTADLKRTSDLVTDSMSAMGIATSDLTHYLDVCTAAQSNSNTTLTALLEAYVGCGGTLRNLNVPLEESAALLGVLANRGIKASEAGTSLNSILVNLMGANKSAKAAMESFGVSAWDAQGNFIGVTNTLKLLDGALESCTEQQKNFLEAKIGGKTQMDTLQALIAGVRDEYDGLYTTLENSQGALEKTSDTMRDNLAGDLTTMHSALEALGDEFYDYLEEPARKAVDAVTDAIKTLTFSVDKGELSAKLKDLSEKVGDLIDKLADFAAKKGIPLLIDGLGKLVDKLSWCADHFEELTIAAEALGGAFIGIKISKLAIDIGVLISVVQTLTTATGEATVATKALGVAMSALPAAAVALAISAVAVALGEVIVESYMAEARMAELRNETDKYGESLTDTVNAINDMRQSMEDAEKETENSIAVADRAIDTLDDLVDENGNLKDAQTNVDEQLKILNETFGLHLEVIDGQIQGYKDLKMSYEDYCQTLRENAKLEAMHPAYVEAVGRSDELKKNVEEAQKKADSAEQKRRDAENAKVNRHGYITHVDEIGVDSDEIEKTDEWKVFEDRIFTTENRYVFADNYNDYLEFLRWQEQEADKQLDEAKAADWQNDKIITDYEKQTYKSGTNDTSTYTDSTASHEEQKGQERLAELTAEEEKQKQDILDQLQELDDQKTVGDIGDEEYYKAVGEIVNNEGYQKIFRDDKPYDKSEFWKHKNKYNSYVERSNKTTGDETGGSSGKTKDPEKEAEQAAAKAISDKKYELNHRLTMEKSNGGYSDEKYYDDLEAFAETLDKDTEAYTKLVNEIAEGRQKLAETAVNTLVSDYKSGDIGSLEELKEEIDSTVSKWKLKNIDVSKYAENQYSGLKSEADKKSAKEQREKDTKSFTDEYDKLADSYKNNLITEEQYQQMLLELKQKYADKDIDISEHIAETEKELYEKKYTDEYDGLAKKYKDGLISEEEYQQELLALKQKYADKDIDISGHIAEKEKEINEKRLEDAQKAQEELNKKIDDRAKELTSGKRYEDVTGVDGKNRKYFTDLNAKKKEIEKYTADLEKLRATNIPPALLDEIMAMDYDDRRDVISELLRLSEGKRELYYNDYTAWQNAARAVAESEFSTEKEAVDKQLADATESTLGNTADYKEYGKEAARAYIDGYTEEFKNWQALSTIPNTAVKASSTDTVRMQEESTVKQAQSADKMTDASKKQAESAEKMTGASEKQVQSADKISDAASAWSDAVREFRSAVQSIPDTIRIDAVSGKTPITINVAGKDVIRTTVGELMRTKRITDA
jgi:TP901 family phage tail tape measure protein